MSSYTNTGAFASRQINRTDDENGDFATFAAAQKKMIEEVVEDLKPYEDTLVIRDGRYWGLKALLAHLRECTEETCEILITPKTFKVQPNVPSPDKQ